MNNDAIHKFKEPVSILHSHIDRSGETLHVLLMSVKDVAAAETKSSCVLHWLQIKIAKGSNDFAVKGWKCFKGENIPKACWFDGDHNNFLVCSEVQYDLVNPSTYGEF